VQAEGLDGTEAPAYGSLIVPSLWVHADSWLELHVTLFGRVTWAFPKIFVQPAEPREPAVIVAFPPRDSE
jgi:hypothetical protein